MKKYVKPEYEVELFESGDIICYSTGRNDLGNYENIGGGGSPTITDDGNGGIGIGIDVSDLL